MALTTQIRAVHADAPAVTGDDDVRLVSFPCPPDPIPPTGVGAVRARVVRPPDPTLPPLLALGWVRPPEAGTPWQKGQVAAASWDPGVYPADGRQVWRCATVTPGTVADCAAPEQMAPLDGGVLWLAPPAGSPANVWDALRLDGGAWCVSGDGGTRCDRFAPVPGSGLTGWNLSGASPPVVWRADGECDGIAPCQNDTGVAYCQADTAGLGHGHHVSRTATGDGHHVSDGRPTLCPPKHKN